MTRRKSFYATGTVSKWYDSLPNRKRSIIINEIITAHINAAKPSPIVTALNEIRDELAGLTITTSAPPTTAPEPEENAADAKKLSELFT